jgi:uncharacterized membrane protein (DUF373 family)
MIDQITGFLKRCEPQTIFRKFMQCIINVLVVYIILVLSIGLIRTLSGIKNFFINMPIGQTFNIVVTEILTFLVIIELFRSFIDYFEAHRFRLNTMIDPAIMFVIRELIVKLYDQQGINWQGLSGFGFLIVCLGIVRTLAVRFSPGEDDHQRMG